MDVVGQAQFDLFIRDYTYAQKELLKRLERLLKQLESEENIRISLQSQIDVITNRVDTLIELIRPLLSPMELRKLDVKLRF